MGVEFDEERFATGWERAMATPAPPMWGEFGRFVGTLAFDDVWNREQLTDRERRLIILTVLALYGRDDICSMHLGASIRKGEFDEEDLDEIAIVLSTYAGVPVGTAFSGLTRRLRAEIEAEAPAGGDDA